MRGFSFFQRSIFWNTNAWLIQASFYLTWPRVLTEAQEAVSAAWLVSVLAIFAPSQNQWPGLVPWLPTPNYIPIFSLLFSALHFSSLFFCFPVLNPEFFWGQWTYLPMWWLNTQHNATRKLFGDFDCSGNINKDTNYRGPATFSLPYEKHFNTFQPVVSGYIFAGFFFRSSCGVLPVQILCIPSFPQASFESNLLAQTREKPIKPSNTQKLVLLIFCVCSICFCVCLRQMYLRAIHSVGTSPKCPKYHVDFLKLISI